MLQTVRQCIAYRGFQQRWTETRLGNWTLSSILILGNTLTNNKSEYYFTATKCTRNNGYQKYFLPVLHDFELHWTKSSSSLHIFYTCRDSYYQLRQCCPTFLTSRAAQEIIIKLRATPVNSKEKTTKDYNVQQVLSL